MRGHCGRGCGLKQTTKEIARPYQLVICEIKLNTEEIDYSFL
jgi:hypothetical protein